MPIDKDGHPRQNLPRVVRWLAKGLLKAMGWTIVGDLKGLGRCVVITQHTSNWDGILSLSAGFVLDVRPRWLGKKELFSGLKGWFANLMGGLPVDRSQSTNLVDQTVARFEGTEILVLFIAPEGTRKKVDYWKSGFYYIALKAGVPIVHGIIDYKRKEVGIGSHFYPSGDIPAALEIIQKMFADMTPHSPEYAAPVRLKPGE